MNNDLRSLKPGFYWLVKMAWRDGKASLKRLMLFMSSIILGIAALVAIQSFSKNLEENIALQSKNLMGADYTIHSKHLPTETAQKIIDSLGLSGFEVNFASMAAFSKSGKSKLVQVRGIGEEFPLYGTIVTKPKSAAKRYSSEKGALVDATLMLQYQLKPGDSVKIGAVSFPILGAVISAPGTSAISATVAPPVIIPYRFVQKTGLLQTGSRIKYNYYFKQAVGYDIEALEKAVDPILAAENAVFDSHISVSRRLGKRYNNFGRFLSLVAFIALLLGCVGIASSVHIYIKEKLRAIAVLKCLGATRKQTFSIFLIQITALGLIGGILGTSLGIFLQQIFPLFLQDFLPFSVDIAITPQPIIMGLLLGVFMSVLFALFPLLSTWYVSPLEVLRVQEHSRPKFKKAGVFLILVILAFLFFCSISLLKDWRYATAFVLTILLIFAILAGISLLFMKGIKQFFPASWSFTTRQSLLNLYRPNNQTMVLILAIGLGSFLISTLYFTKDILLAKTTIDGNKKNPNIILLDIQTNQKEEVAKSIKPFGLPVLANIPIVTMRIERIKGKTVNHLRLDTTATVKKWILNHEFRATFRADMIGSEKLASGVWKNEIPEDGAIPISLSDNVARDADVVVGDTLLFNVQSVLMKTYVASIRNVDWGRMQLNFSVVFPEGVLENAPQMHVITTNAPNEETSAQLQQELVAKFPNVSVIDLRQILSLVQGILDKITWVINFMVFFSILTGLIVLMGSIRTSKYQRVKESVLLRTLGAKSSQILKITALEYFYLGVLGGCIGIFLSLLSSQLLAWLVFDTPFVPSWVPFLVLLPSIIFIVLAIGLLNSRTVLNSSPLQVLRSEL